jgi:Zn-dependent peptidase ImmA (M78 family)
MDYLNYKKSRDLSWQVLIDNNITELPVKVSRICKNLDIPVISYEKGEQIIKTAGLEKICSQNDGITFMGAIFYNQKCSIGRQRFTIAHELVRLISSLI